MCEGRSLSVVPERSRGISKKVPLRLRDGISRLSVGMTKGRTRVTSKNGNKTRISAFDCRAQRYRCGYALRDTDFHRRSVHFSSAKRETHAGPERSGDRSGEEECEGGRVCHVQPARTRSTGQGKKSAALRKSPGAFSNKTGSKTGKGTG